jgi:hypothetical protein
MSPVPQHKSSALAGPHRCQFSDSPLPAPVQAETLQVVDQVVARRDCGEQGIDFCRALIARTIESVCHSGGEMARRTYQEWTIPY